MGFAPVVFNRVFISFEKSSDIQDVLDQESLLPVCFQAVISACSLLKGRKLSAVAHSSSVLFYC